MLSVRQKSGNKKTPLRLAEAVFFVGGINTDIECSAILVKYKMYFMKMR